MRMKNKIGIWFAAALFSAAFVLAGCGRSAVPTAKTDAGYKACESADYRTAEASFTEALQEGEDPVQAYRGLGIAQMGQAKYAEAAESFNSALASTDDRMPEAVKDLLQYKAASQYRAEDYAGTVETCDELIERDDSLVDAWYYRGAARLHEGSQEEAKAAFDYAASLRPNDYELYLNIYSVYEDVRLSGIGDGYLQTALGIAPTDSEGYYRVGQIYYYLEQYDEAANALIKPVDEKYVPALSLMGRIYLAKGENDNANAIYTEIRQLEGDSTESFNGLALCALASGDPDTALNYIAQGLELPGGEGKQELYFNEIVAHEKKLDFLTARDKCRTYVEMYPTDEAGQKELKFLNTRG